MHATCCVARLWLSTNCTLLCPPPVQASIRQALEQAEREQRRTGISGFHAFVPRSSRRFGGGMLNEGDSHSTWVFAGHGGGVDFEQDSWGRHLVQVGAGSRGTELLELEGQRAGSTCRRRQPAFVHLCPAWCKRRHPIPLPPTTLAPSAGRWRRPAPSTWPSWPSKTRRLRSM